MVNTRCTSVRSIKRSFQVICRFRWLSLILQMFGQQQTGARITRKGVDDGNEFLFRGLSLSGAEQLSAGQAWSNEFRLLLADMLQPLLRRRTALPVL